MTKNTAPERLVAAVGESNLFSVSFANVLDSGELLASVTDIVDNAGGATLTISSKAVSTAALIINGKTVAIGKALQFLVTGAVVAGTPYTLKMTAVTDSTPAQTKVKYVTFTVEGP